MPTGTPVDRMFQALKREGHSVASAARIAQSRTGLALATGKPPRHGHPSEQVRGQASERGFEGKQNAMQRRRHKREQYQNAMRLGESR